MTLRIAVCVPSQGMWCSKTGLAIAGMVDSFNNAGYDGGEKAIRVFSVTGSQLLENRHKLVAQAWEWNATHILWVDSDMFFPIDVIQRFLAHGKHAVAANYSRKSIPALPTAYVEGEDYIGPLYTGEKSQGLVEVRHAGLGLMLTHIDIYEHIEMPFFSFDPISPHNIRFEGEDVTFCRRMQKAGFKLYVDHDVSKFVQHIGQYEFENLYTEISKDTLLEMHGKNKAGQMGAFLENRPAVEGDGEVIMNA